MGILVFLYQQGRFLMSVYIVHGERKDSDQEPQGHMPVLLDLEFLPWAFLCL